MVTVSKAHTLKGKASMTTTIEETTPAETKAEKATRQATLPKTVGELEAITEIPTTEATRSFAKFMNAHVKASNFEGITEEQAWTVVGAHRVWQQSEERSAEKEALKAEAAKAKEEAKAKREAKAEENKAKKAAADAKKAKAAEAKKAKEAAEADSDDDLDSVDDTPEEGEGSIDDAAKTTGRKRRPRAGASTQF